MTFAASQSAASLRRPFSLREFWCDLSGRPFLSRVQKILVLAVTVLSLSSGFSARAQAAGDLDPSFGDGGITPAQIFIEQKDQTSYALAIQPDGKIVVVGCVIKSPGGETTIASYAPSNVVAGQGDFDFALIRYNVDGTPDLTFGAPPSGTGVGTGKVMTDFGGVDSAHGVAIQRDGKIVVVGGTGSHSTYDSIAMVRYNRDGSLDNTFGTGGKVTDPTGNIHGMKAVLIQPDGKIVVAGDELVRYFSDGSLDIIFSFVDPLPIPDRIISAEAIALRGDGKIVVAGSALIPGTIGTRFALACYNPDGTLDNSFGSYGKTFTDFSSLYGGGNGSPNKYDVALSLAIQPDGKIVAGGTVANRVITIVQEWGPPYIYRNSVFALARYTSNGILDQGFGTGGMVLTNFYDTTTGPSAGTSYEYSEAHSVLLRRDGKITAVGHAGMTPIAVYDPTGGSAITRYNSDGSLDQTFGANGKSLALSRLGMVDAALQRDGKIVGDTSTFGVERYLSDSSDIFQEALLKYVPILRFNTGENFFPLAVEAITDNPGNKLVGVGGTIAQNPGKRFIPQLSISFLNSLYPSGLPAQDSDKIVERHGGRNGKYETYKADAWRLQSDERYADRIYGRVYYGMDGSGRKIAWLQYWFFYYYNNYKGVRLGVRLGQHEGDWEMIQIALDVNAHPVSAVYAQHDGGSQCEWAGGEIEKSGLNHERPVVYVALGSHASYFHAGRHRLHAPIAYDYADGLVERPDPQLVIITENSPGWINWPGHWGGTTKPLLIQGAYADSPRGPKFQPDNKWNSPQAFSSGVAFDCK